MVYDRLVILLTFCNLASNRVTLSYDQLSPQLAYLVDIFVTDSNVVNFILTQEVGGNSQRACRDNVVDKA